MSILFSLCEEHGLSDDVQPTCIVTMMDTSFAVDDDTIQFFGVSEFQYLCMHDTRRLLQWLGETQVYLE